MVCILKHLNVVLIKNGIEYHYACDSSGMEIGEPVSNNSYPGGSPDRRKYLCTNCLKMWEAEEENSFTEPRIHLGKNWVD